MKVLWVTNIAIPKIAEAMGERSVPVGGWMVRLADEIAAVPEIRLHILFPYGSFVEGRMAELSYTGFVADDREHVKRILTAVQPDVVHIHGTEGIHSNVVVRACEELGLIDRVVVSIQGLMSVYARHYCAYLPHRVVSGFTLRDLLKGSVARNQRAFEAAGRRELDTLRRVKHILGRTDWDRAATRQINPQAQYHFCGEMLRESFYHSRWSLDRCDRFSIFCSQATLPLKGIHFAIEAMGLLKRRYPQARLWIAGKSYTAKPAYQRSYYEKYVLRLIDRYGLQDSVRFTGFLDERQMCERYLKSHVFVSSSSIENSPNSVCEAMLLGMPVVSSLVGGVANLMTHGEDGFCYPADAPYMLAEYVGRVFDDDRLATRLGEAAHRTAAERHDAAKIVEELVGVYRSTTKG